MTWLSSLFGEGNVSTPGVPVTREDEPLSDAECVRRAELIRELGERPADGALEGLFRVLQYDARGELAVHASLALATHTDLGTMKSYIERIYNTAPPVSGAGYPPAPDPNVYPRSRLLYPLAWLGDAVLMRQLIDNSGSWPGAAMSQSLSCQLADDAEMGPQAVVDRIIYMEYLDEAGTRELMDLTIEWYPSVGLAADTWRSVRR